MRYLPLVFALGLAPVVAGEASATAVGAVPTASISFGSLGIDVPLSPVDSKGGFTGRNSVVLCDGSVRVGSACAQGEEIDALVSFVVEGSIYPFIEGVISSFDAGSATSMTASFSSLIPDIAGASITSISGSVTVPADRTLEPVETALDDAFVEGIVGGPGGMMEPANVEVKTITPDETQVRTVTFAPIGGTFDCAVVNGCTLIAVAMGVKGHGGGTSYVLSGRFDLDAVTTTPVPLPASLPLLVGAFAALGVAAGRRRARMKAR